MPNGPSQAISRTTYPALNDINDAVAGGQASISGAATYAAQLGARVWLDGNAGGVRYDTAVGTLYGGCFQYVRLYASASAAVTVGRPAVWAYDQLTTCFENYTVTTDGNSALRTGRIAGIFLNVITAGYYGWIQTKGKVKVKFTTLTGTPVDGDLVYLDASSGLALNANDGVTVTTTILKALIGVALGAPTTGGTTLVLLRGIPDVV
jgi:hypothetical protein